MIRRRRRHVPIISDSSDGSRPQRRKQQINRQARSAVSNHNRNLRSNRWEDSSSNSSSSFALSSSETSSSSENEEILHPRRSGSLRALSDYETGDSSDKASETPTQAPCNVRQLQGGINLRSSLNLVRNSVQRHNSSESSSDDSTIQTRSAIKRTRQSNPISTSDSSDSGMPIGFVRKKKRMKLSTSSEENDSDHLAVIEPNTNATVGNRTERVRDRPTTSQDRSLSRLRVRHRHNNRETIPNDRRSLNSQTTRRIPDIQMNIELSSDSDIRPRILRHRRVPIFASNTSSSSEDENFPRRNPIRRGAMIAIHESDEDNGVLNTSRNSISFHEVVGVKTASPDKTIIPTKKSCGVSSDSDGESEKCPICLTRFLAQEVGKPATCDHCFCLICILEWAKNNNTCPVDRKVFNTIVVRADIQGKVIREIPVENPPTRFEQGIDDVVAVMWENATNIGFFSDESWFSEYDSDYDGPEEVCCVCMESHPNDNMIVCDYCNNVYHMHCLVPPLQYVSATDWYCPDCEEVEMSTADSSSDSDSDN